MLSDQHSKVHNLTDPQNILDAVVADREQSVMDAVVADHEQEQVQLAIPKPKPKKKEYNQMWQNLQYMESQSKKFELDEEKYIPKEDEKEEEVKRKKVEITEKDLEEKLDGNYDDDSLTLYGNVLSDSISKSKPGKESAKMKKAIGEVLSQER
jgi:hypothetical protein